MKKITIKGSTTEGVKEIDGVLFEAQGYQFCLCHDKEEGFFRAIELSSGCSVQSLDDDLWTKSHATRTLKVAILDKTPDDYKYAIEKAKNSYGKKYGIKFPLNEGIKL